MIMLKLVFLHLIRFVRMSFQAYGVMSLTSTYLIIDCLFFHLPQLVYPTSRATLPLFAQGLLLTFTISYPGEGLMKSLISTLINTHLTGPLHVLNLLIISHSAFSRFRFLKLLCSSHLSQFIGFLLPLLIEYF